MTKEIVPYLFNFHSDDLCEFLPNEYCQSMKCEACPFHKTPGVALLKLYCVKDKEDENK